MDRGPDDERQKGKIKNSFSPVRVVIIYLYRQYMAIYFNEEWQTANKKVKLSLSTPWRKHVALLTLTLGIRQRCVVNVMPRLLFPRERTPVPLYRKLGGGLQSRSGHFAGKNLLPIRSTKRFLFLFSWIPPLLLSLYFPRTYFFVVTVLTCSLSLLYNIHNTNIQAPSGIRTRHPCKQSTTGIGKIPAPGRIRSTIPRLSSP
jgi:hypothetical protein